MSRSVAVPRMPSPPAVAVSGESATRDRFVTELAGFRVEHRPPDGPARVLAETTMLSLAQQSAQQWARRLQASGHPGVVVVARAATGEALSTRPLAPAPPAQGPFTDRQAGVLALVCAGHANADIADRLGVTLNAVYRLRAEIRGRLGGASLTEACRRLDKAVTDGGIAGN